MKGGKNLRQAEDKRSVQHAKSKAEALDWERAVNGLRELAELPGDIVASDSERERLLSVYNRALNQALSGNSDIALIGLEKLASSWPQFAEASALYGLLLARDRRFSEAEEQFEKTLLASPDTRLFPTVDRYRMAAREERIREQAKDNSRRRSESLLTPVRAHMAKSGILQRAADPEGTGRIQMASRREQDEVLRMAEGISDDGKRTRGMLSRLIQGLTIAVIAASLLFLVFYFAVRPVIVRNEARRERLNWLERILEERQEDESVAEILEMYKKTFPLQESGGD